MIKRYLSSLALALGLAAVAVPALAAEGEDLPPSGANVYDQASLQRGAKLFFNYCVGCHSLKYVRYSRLASDLGLTEGLVRQRAAGSHPGSPGQGPGLHLQLPELVLPGPEPPGGLEQHGVP
jgi:cytochrome c1